MSRNFDIIIVVPADTDEHENAKIVTAEIDVNNGTVIIEQPGLDDDHDDAIVLTRKQAIQLRDGLHHLLGDC